MISTKIEKEAIQMFQEEYHSDNLEWNEADETLKGVFRAIAIKQEQKKCQEDLVYFYENYILVNGKKPILKGRDKEFLRAFNRKRT